MKKFAAIILFLALIAGATQYLRQRQVSNPQVVRVYVPCGMTIPFKELAMAYQKNYRGTKVEATFDNANVLVKLIVDKGRPADVFISPGAKEMGALAEKGFIEKGSIRPFGRYELILIAPSQSESVKGLEDILSGRVKTIAIANPEFNSIGADAKEALASLGYWDKIQEKVVLTNTPIEALSYIATSKADAGIHYNICPFDTNSDKVAQGAIRIVAALPAGSHKPIHSYAGILKNSQNKNGAKGFIDFMFSKKGSGILSRYGLREAAPAASGAAAAVAKVVVEAYYPFNDEHICMKDYIDSLADKYKGKIRVECIDFRTDEGYVRWRKTGLSCGGVLVNGKNKVTIKVNGKPREVEFIKRVDIFWTREDLEKAIEQEIEK